MVLQSVIEEWEWCDLVQGYFPQEYDSIIKSLERSERDEIDCLIRYVM